MQPLPPPSAPYVFTSGGTTRRLSSAESYDSSAELGFTTARSYHHQPSAHAYGPGSGAGHTSYQTTSSIAQSHYSASHNTGVMSHPSPPSPSNSLSPIHPAHTWPSSTPSPPSFHHGPSGRSTYDSTPAYDAHPSRNSAYAGYDGYDSSRANLAYNPQASSVHYGGALHVTSYAHDSDYHPPTRPNTLGFAPHPTLETPGSRDTKPAPVSCEWGNCRLPLEDSSPAGIARHLRQYHGVVVTDNRTRSPCLWGGRRCNKDMYMSSFGKHIAECHLRNMVKQCPQCGADFARADTLSRHIKAFCPNSSG
ncbi:hypothetical protein C8Q78DRAFT_591243 [Trametes maxima]|nr:hypothetical protein C8Q78DRAFT_591243 [Trametes maxima]